MEEDVLYEEVKGRVEGDEEPTFLPPFANAENKALDAEIQDMEKQLQQVDLELEENAGRVTVMDEHLKNVQQEIMYAQHRVEAEKREIETEGHLKLMANKETARMHKDMARLKTQRQELSDRITSLQASVFKGSEKLDQFKLLMNWNQEELDQWSLAQQQKEEDNQALDKYRRQDVGKLQQLSLAIEKLTQQVAAQKSALEAEVTDTQAAQIQLDRAAQDFRQLHQERQDLIRQWDEARDAMKSRDEAIQAMATAFAKRKVFLKQRQAELNAQARFLAGEIANNREFEAQIVFYEHEMAKARELQAQEAAKLEELVNHVDLMQATLTKAANDLATASNDTEAARKEVEIRKKRLEAVRKRHVVLKQQLEGQFNHLDSLEAKVSELEAMRKREEGNLKALQKEHQQLKKDQFKAAQALHLLRQAEKELISDIAGGQGQAKNLTARQKTLDEQLQRQGELMYAVEFSLQEMEHRIARAGGHRSDDEARALNARIADLSKLLETVSSEYAMLTTQMKQAELDLSDARRTSGAFTGSLKRLEESIAALQLETSSVARALKETIAARERQLVEHDVLKLQVQRLREVLSMHATDVYTLESRKVALKTSLDERRHEIEVHRDSLRSELKLVRDDVHRITLELRDRQTKVDVLHAKFETLASRVHGTDADGGEPKSQAYYIVKAAQEREELQAAGDRLDAKITQCEAEVEALTTTLAQMQATNVAFSSSLHSAESDVSQEQQRLLRDQLDASYDKLKALRQEEAALLGELAAQQASTTSSADELAGLQAQLEEASRRKAEGQKQLAEQQEKQARAFKAVQRAQKLLATHVSMAQQRPASGSTQQRPGSGVNSGVSSGSSTYRESASAGADVSAVVADAAELEADVQLTQLRLVMRGMLQELQTLDGQSPDAGIAAALTAAGFKLPSSAVYSRSTSRAGSKAGSLGRSPSSAGHSVEGGSTKSSSIVSSSSRSKLGAPGLGKIASVKNISFG